MGKIVNVKIMVVRPDNTARSFTGADYSHDRENRVIRIFNEKKEEIKRLIIPENCFVEIDELNPKPVKENVQK